MFNFSAILEELGMVFNPMNFVHSLQYLGQGMLGIFVVMLIIILTTMLLNKLTSKKK